MKKKKILFVILGLLGLLTFSSCGNSKLEQIKSKDNQTIKLSMSSSTVDYIAGKSEYPGDLYYPYKLFVEHATNLKINSCEVYDAEMNDGDFSLTYTFEKNKLYILNGYSSEESSWEEPSGFLDLYGMSLNEISKNSFYYKFFGNEMNLYYDDYQNNDIEKLIVNDWNEKLNTILNIQTFAGYHDFAYYGANITFIPKETMTFQLDVSKFHLYPTSYYYIAELDLEGWSAPDLQAPSLEIPSTYIVNVDRMQGWDEIKSHFVIRDDIDPNPKLEIIESDYNPEIRQIGDYPSKVCAVDAAGNQSPEYPIIIKVMDSTAPSGTAEKITIGNKESDFLSIETVYNAVAAIDNYDSADKLVKTVITNEWTANRRTPGTYEIVVRVSDSSSNYVDISVPVEVKDTTLPTGVANKITIGNNRKLSLEEKVAAIIADDDQVYIVKEITEDNYEDNYTIPGTYTYVVKIVDGAGNFVIVNNEIEVFDNVPPTATFTPLKTNYLTKLEDKVFLDSVVANDDQGNATKEIYENAYAENYSIVGSYYVIVRVSDGRNYIDVSVPAEVIDDVMPVIVAPEEITISNSKFYSDNDFKNKLNVFDGYDGQLSNYVINDLDNYALNYRKPGVYRKEIVATDLAGNVNRYISKYKIIDGTAPDVLVDGYVICLQTGETLTDDMIKRYAAQALNLPLEDIVSLEGEYNPDEAGLYAVNLCMSDGNVQTFNISVLDHAESNSKDIKEFVKTNKMAIIISSISGLLLIGCVVAIVVVVKRKKD